MATVYWLSSVDTDWNSAGNWFSDNPPVTPYGSIPQGGDTVVLIGTVMPTVDPSASVALLSFDGSQASAGAAFTLGASGNITFVGGTITLGIAADASDAQVLTASSSSSGSNTLIVQGGGHLIVAAATTLTANTVAGSDSGIVEANGTLTLTVGASTFSGSSTLIGSGTLGIGGGGASSLTFSSSSSLNMGGATLNGNSNTGLAFHGSSSLVGGTIGSFTSVTLDGSATMPGGNVSSAATFSGSATQTGGITGGSGAAVSFTGGSVLNGGNVANGAALTINSTANQTGTVDGSAFTLTAGDKTFSSIVSTTSNLPNGTTIDLKIGPGGNFAANSNMLNVVYPSVSGGSGVRTGPGTNGGINQ